MPHQSTTVEVDALTGTVSGVQRILFWTLQPALLGAVLVAWHYAPHSALLVPLILLAVQGTIALIEYRFPARSGWHQTGGEKCALVLIALVCLFAGEHASALYNAALAEPLAKLRSDLDLDIWPHHWPLTMQALLVFLTSEFLWYWIHRAEHRWPMVWRISGHGAHHAFKKLNAINALANHPVELFWIVLPTLLVDLFFGVGAAAIGAALLSTTQTAIVHANLRLNSRVIGLVFTTNAWHIRHHSAHRGESNTNYGCSAIIWDRLFGTFERGGVAEAGIGPREPSTLEKLLIPLREPRGSVVAPGSAETAATP